jgi:hypothetical protein
MSFASLILGGTKNAHSRNNLDNPTVYERAILYCTVIDDIHTKTEKVC